MWNWHLIFSQSMYSYKVRNSYHVVKISFKSRTFLVSPFITKQWPLIVPHRCRREEVLPRVSSAQVQKHKPCEWGFSRDRSWASGFWVAHPVLASRAARQLLSTAEGREAGSETSTELAALRFGMIPLGRLQVFGSFPQFLESGF